MRQILLTIVSCLLIACSAGVPPTQEPLKVLPPSNLTQAPARLPQPENGKMRTLEADHRMVAKMYHKLATQMCELLRNLGIEREECVDYYGDKKSYD